MQPHGTPAGYRRHRKRREPPCPPCAEAWRDACRGWERTRSRNLTAVADPHPGTLGYVWGDREGRVPVLCWCESEVVRVSLTDLRAGLTGSCGHTACRPAVAA